MEGGGWIYQAMGVGRWRDSSAGCLKSLDLHETHEQDAAAVPAVAAVAAVAAAETAAAVAVTGKLRNLSFGIQKFAVAVPAAV